MAGHSGPRMDDVMSALTDYVVGTTDLTAQARDAVAMHMVDTYGCAIAATDWEPCRIARNLAGTSPTTKGASVIGLADLVSPEMAAFANSCMVRCLDFNDTFNSKSGGHPSVFFPGMLAVAEANGLSGADAARGIHVSSEVFGALCDAVSLRDNGWDAGLWVGIACAAGVASTLRLSAEATSHAIALAASSGIPLGVIRAGQLSAWKGCAEGHATLNGVLHARLAAAGMTGPAQAFRGVTGLEQQIHAKFEWQGVGEPRDGKTLLERTTIKFLPIQFTTQAPVERMLELSARIRPEQVAKITITGNNFMLRAVGGGRGDHDDKWDPQTRETADHSLPYLVAVALHDREVTLASFEPARVRDPQLRPLMNKIEVVEDPAKTALPATRQPVDIVITLTDGQVIREQVEYAKGHGTRPPTKDDVDAKYMRLIGRILDEAPAKHIRDLLWRINELPDLGELSAALRGCPS